MAYRQRRAPTAEQQARAEERRQRFTELARTIAGMTEGERAAMAERMAGAATIEGRRLSVHNACLLACQRPDATLVGGFQQWRQHGRVVRKGEHGMMIWAPVKGREEHGATAPDPGELKAERPSFIMVTVFDVEQTDGVS